MFSALFKCIALYLKKGQFLWHPLCRCIKPHLTIYDLTLWDLSEKMALLYNITPQQISHIYRQGPTGIHVLVSDE
ncbi:unnamed protein product, partial [Coregonus sp. 'balchen']